MPFLQALTYVDGHIETKQQWSANRLSLPSFDDVAELYWILLACNTLDVIDTLLGRRPQYPQHNSSDAPASTADETLKTIRLLVKFDNNSHGL